MVDTLTRQVALWTIEVGTAAARLPANAARTAFLAEQRRRLAAEARAQGMSEREIAILAESCIAGAERVMRELLARGGVGEGGRT